jgi:hypothetical protein
MLVSRSRSAPACSSPPRSSSMTAGTGPTSTRTPLRRHDLVGLGDRRRACVRLYRPDRYRGVLRYDLQDVPIQVRPRIEQSGGQGHGEGCRRKAGVVPRGRHDHEPRHLSDLYQRQGGVPHVRACQRSCDNPIRKATQALAHVAPGTSVDLVPKWRTFDPTGKAGRHLSLQEAMRRCELAPNEDEVGKCSNCQRNESDPLRCIVHVLLAPDNGCAAHRPDDLAGTRRAILRPSAAIDPPGPISSQCSRVASLARLRL